MKLKSPYIVKPHTKVRLSQFSTDDSGRFGNKATIDAAMIANRKKLAGLQEAPHQVAVFCDEATDQGGGLGRRTMPEMLRYSAVLAVYTLWLAARVEGVGIGWVSILDPSYVHDVLQVPVSWSLVAYLCVGYAIAEDDVPELERAGWERRHPLRQLVLQR